jgi:hypothetical protein
LTDGKLYIAGAGFGNAFGIDHPAAVSMIMAYRICPSSRFRSFSSR